MGLRARNKAAGPYIPSYMETGELCVVCGDLATGLHYRCMTCEGCKGFFRRTIQRRLHYECKGGKLECSVDKSTRNQCQQCRYEKCIKVGMATDLVLNDNQRVAKRQLIEENRERKRLEQIRDELKAKAAEVDDSISGAERSLINSITDSYCRTIDAKVYGDDSSDLGIGGGSGDGVAAGKLVNSMNGDNTCDSFQASSDLSAGDALLANTASWRMVMAPLIRLCIDFAKGVPSFCELPATDQKLLLDNFCWLELLLLRVAQQYDDERDCLLLPEGRTFDVNGSDRQFSDQLGRLLRPLARFAQSTCALQLDNSEIALVAALLVLNPEREGLSDPVKVEQAQESVLCALKKHMKKTSDSPDVVRWPKLMLNVAELRAVAYRLQPEYCDVANAHRLVMVFGRRTAE